MCELDLLFKMKLMMLSLILVLRNKQIIVQGLNLHIKNKNNQNSGHVFSLIHKEINLLVYLFPIFLLKVLISIKFLPLLQTKMMSGSKLVSLLFKMFWMGIMELILFMDKLVQARLPWLKNLCSRSLQVNGKRVRWCFQQHLLQRVSNNIVCQN